MKRNTFAQHLATTTILYLAAFLSFTSSIPVPERIPLLRPGVKTLPFFTDQAYQKPGGVSADPTAARSAATNVAADRQPEVLILEEASEAELMAGGAGKNFICIGETCTFWPEELAVVVKQDVKDFEETERQLNPMPAQLPWLETDEVAERQMNPRPAQLPWLETDEVVERQINPRPVQIPFNPRRPAQLPWLQKRDDVEERQANPRPVQLPSWFYG